MKDQLISHKESDNDIKKLSQLSSNSMVSPISRGSSLIGDLLKAIFKLLGFTQ